MVAEAASLRLARKGRKRRMEAMQTIVEIEQINFQKIEL
jgi:hypothetical protein